MLQNEEKETVYNQKCEAFKKELKSPSMLVLAVTEDRENIAFFMQTENIDRAKFIFILEGIVEQEKNKMVNEIISMGTDILQKIVDDKKNNEEDACKVQEQ